MTRRAVLGGVLASAAMISVLTIASRITGFGRWLVLSGTVGATCVGNAYASVNLLPNLLFEVLAGGALAAAVIPLLRGQFGPAPDRVASALLTWTLLVLAPVSLALAVFARPLARLVIGAEDCAGQHALAAAMLMVFAPQVLLYGVGVVLTGVLQAGHRFAWPAVAPLLSSLVVIGAYLGYAAAVSGTGDSITGANLPPPAFAWLAWGTTAGVAVLTLPLLVPVHRAGIRLRPALGFPPGVARRAVRLAGSGIAAVLAQQLFLLVVMLLANARGPVGSFLVYGYTQAVALLPHAVLAVPLVTAAFPRLVQQAGGRGFAVSAARYTRLVLVAGAVGGALLAGTAPAVAALFAALDRGSVTAMGAALVAAAPGVVGLALVTYVGRVLFAVEAARSAALAAAVGWGTATTAAALAVSVVPAQRTVVALSGAGSVGLLVGALTSIVVLRRIAGRRALAGLGRTGAVVLPSALVAAGVGWTVARSLVSAAPSGSAVGALGAGLIAAVVATTLVAVPVLVFDRGLLRRTPGAGAPSEPPEPPLRVVLVLGSSAGGIGRHVRALAQGLSDRGIPVLVAAPEATLAGVGPNVVGLPGASAVALPIGERPNPVRDLATVRRLRSLGSGAVVVHAHGLRAGALAVLAARGTRTPVVVTVHNAPVAGGPAAVVYRLLERVVARGADQVLVVSADLGQRMRALGAAAVERALVPAPTRAEQTAPVAGSAPTDRHAVRAEVGAGPKELVLVTVARLAEQKGLPILLDAVAQLSDLPVRAVVAGEGPMRAELGRDIAARRLPVHLLGPRDDVAELLAAADLVVVPSRWEGQPLIVQEALAAGAAIVATDAGGTAEVAGDAAVLVPADDPTALAGAVRALAADRHRAADLRARALARAAELPTEGDALDQVIAVYRRLRTDSLEPRGAAHI